jgi:cation-transporting P-type ATPase 13A2
MSVIVKDINSLKYKAYVKGSPEKVAELCNKSTLPVEYERILEEYTNKGYRVIALATKSMEGFKFI